MRIVVSHFEYFIIFVADTQTLAFPKICNFTTQTSTLSLTATIIVVLHLIFEIIFV